MQNLITKLENILERSPNTIRAEVAEEALNHGSTNDEIKNFFNDLERSGCVSGMISSLVYYQDTEEFFDQYIDEIDNLVTQFKEMTGMELQLKNIKSFKNDISWFAFEMTARQLFEEIVSF